MSEAIKPTPGPWVMTEGKCIYINARVDGKRRFILQRSTGEGCGINVEAEQVRADCRLIAEAGTVHHETGLTPRQLVEQARKLEEALRNLDDYVCNNLSSDYPTGVDVNGAEFKAARAALSKSLPNTVAEVK